MITFLIPTYKEFSNIELIVNKINAAYNKGILKISIAKKKEAIPLPVKSIKIA